VRRDLLGNSTLEPATIVIHRYGGFGNNCMQMFDAIRYAEALAVDSIYLPLGFLFLNETFKITPFITVLTGVAAPATPAIVINMYTWGDRPCRKQKPRELAPLFSERVVRHFPSYLANASRFYAHVRGGDIFRGKSPAVEGFHYQPPCRYYTSAIEDLEEVAYADVTVLSLDSANPCVSVLVDLGANWTVRPLFDDLGAMLHAPRVALAIGTFGLAICWLTRQKERVYTFQTHYWLGFGPHIDCDPSPDFARRGKLGEEWTRIMKTAYCVTWEWL
jgi:hypothetical protein